MSDNIERMATSPIPPAVVRLVEEMTPAPPRPLPVVLGDGPAPAIAGERSCGSCAECCLALEVTEIRKPAFRPCGELRKVDGSRGRCGVYDTRPVSCGTYRCLWLLGIIGEQRDRPDRVGIVFDVPADLVTHPIWSGLPVMFARVTRGTALREKRTALLLTAVARKNVVVLVHPDDSTNDGTGVGRIIGPTLLMDEVRARVSAQNPGMQVERVGQAIRVRPQEGSDGSRP